MNISLDASDVQGILSALTLYNEEENTYRSKNQIKADKKLASEITKDFKNMRISFSSEKHHLIMLSVVFSYEYLTDLQLALAGDMAGLVETQQLLKKIEPVYKKYLPFLESLENTEC